MSIQFDEKEKLFKQEELPPEVSNPLSSLEQIGDSVNLSSGNIQSPDFSKGRSGWRVTSDGDAEFNDAVIRGTIVIGGEYITVKVGDSIQDAIDSVNSAGGGVVVLENGTHTPASDITLYSKITLQGQNGDSAIIDFQGGSYQIKGIGSSAYTTGTISVTNNSTTVTGSGTSWSGNVSAGQNILLSGVWYPIASVDSNTQLTIAIPYADVTLSGASYTVATILTNIHLNALTVKNSATSAIKFRYINNLFIEDVSTQTSLVGFDLQDSSQITFNNSDTVANYSNYSFTNIHFMISSGNSSLDALTGNGYTIDKMSNVAITATFVLNSAGDGMNATNMTNSRIDGVFAENGGNGIEFVSGNNNIILTQTRIESNGSDGIKLTATSDNIFISNGFIQSNTGYGINISASSCDNTVITGNNFASNTTSACNDSGTGTVIRGNVGLTDNSTNAVDLSSIGFYGDGSDGSATISVDTTLSADKQYESLTINSGVSLNTNGYTVYVKNTTNNSGTIHNNGSNASGTTGGSGGGGATFPAGKTGGNGGSAVAAGVGQNGTNGTNANPSIGSNGVAGGNGGSGNGGSGGTAGTAGTATGENLTIKASAFETTPNLTSGTEDNIQKKFKGYGSSSGTTLSSSAGSGGGGSGAGHAGTGGASGAGGGAGGSGGVVFLCSKTISNSGTISSNGGNGANGGNASEGTPSDKGGGGGGAGGSGGVVILIYETLNNSGSIVASGGSKGLGGTKLGTGVNGSNGTDGLSGKVFKLKVS